MSRTATGRIFELVGLAIKKRGFKELEKEELSKGSALAVKPIYDLTVVTREDRGPVAVITMNRPEAANALNTKVLQALETIIREAQGDPTIRCIVLRHQGKDFAGGADIGDFVANIKSGDPERNLAYVRLGHRVLGDVIANSKKPVIAIADGAAIGGGFELFLAAHILIATPRFQAGLPEVKLGLVPGFGGAWSLVHRADKFVAEAMILGGMEVDGETAYALGLVDCLIRNIGKEDMIIGLAAVFPWKTSTPEQFLASLRGRQELLLQPGSITWQPLRVFSPFAAKHAKALIDKARQAPTLADGLRQAEEVLPEIFAHPDALEGLTSMRNPKFKSA